MKRIEATITDQGRVTIPVEVRRALGIRGYGQVEFVVDAEGVRLQAPRFTLEEVFGSVESISGTSADFDREIESAMAAETLRLRT